MIRVWLSLLLSLSLCLALLVSLPLPLQAQTNISKASQTVAFINVSVVPMDKEQLLSGQTVIVQDGRIVEVVDQAKAKIPEGAIKIDGQGKYLMPGLVDMHVHLFDSHDLDLFVANGVTTVRNMWGTPINLTWRSQIAQGELFGPTLYTAGPLVDGNPPIWPGSTVVETPEAADQTVVEQKKAGYDFIKCYSRLKLDVYKALMAAAKREGIRVVGHVPDAVGLKIALEQGQASIEHLTGFFGMLKPDNATPIDPAEPGSRLKFFNSLDEKKMPAVAALVKEAKVWNCVTLIVYQRLVSPEEAQELRKRPEMKYVSPATMAFWDPTKDFRTKNLTKADFEANKVGNVIRKKLTGALNQAGAKILLGTDTPNPFVVPGFSIHEELQNLVGAGLTPYQAIQAGTYNAAEFLEALNEFGTVSVGKRADLLLVDGNPLQDVANVAKISGVMLRGKWLPKQELDTKLAALAKLYTKDSFADRVPLAKEGEQEFFGRYEIKYNDIPVSQERFSIQKLANGQRAVRAQSFPSPNSIDTLRIVLDANGQVQLLRYFQEEGKARSDITITCPTSPEATWQLNENGQESSIKATKDLILGSPNIASYLILAERIKDLPVGSKLSLKQKSIINVPKTHLGDLSLDIERQPDAESSVAGLASQTKVYTISVNSELGPYTTMLTLDTQNRPVSLAIRLGAATISYQRIE